MIGNTPILQKDLDHMIPWHNSKMTQENQKILTKMITTYPKNHPLTLFLTTNRIQNTNAPIDTTNILYQFFTIKELESNKNTVRLNTALTPSQFSDDPGVHLVYYRENKKCYVGSATNYRARWQNHYASFGRNNKNTGIFFSQYIKDINPNILK
jgi:hypothetical protein